MFPQHAPILHSKIASVCPIVGVAIGDPNNPATWRIDFDPSATPSQIATAQAQLAAITPAALAAADASIQVAAAAILDPLAAAKTNAIAGLPTATAIPTGSIKTAP